MAQVDDSEHDKGQTGQPNSTDNNVKVYDRPARVFPLPAWLIYVFVLLGAALLWFLFAYVF